MGKFTKSEFAYLSTTPSITVNSSSFVLARSISIRVCLKSGIPLKTEVAAK
jgi:hypothetical protein